MEKKKVTKRERFAEMLTIPEIAQNPDYKAFIEHEIELLEKKNSADRKPTKVQESNERLKAMIITALETAKKACTITEIMKSLPEEFEGNLITNQKISALANRMVDEGKLTKTTDKRKSLFSVAEQ